ncbi:MAG TPA: metallopeptidase [Halieaceae bacterium]|nr:metallopeptidase [Halieaceae bacterium]
MSEPLSRQQQQLLETTRYWVAKAESLYGRIFQMPEVRFDLRGQTAGQYRGGSHPCIRYNLELAAIQFKAYCDRTPPHEVAHFIIEQIHPNRSVKPHGTQWQNLMQAFGLEPSRCHQYDLKNVRQRRQKRHAYLCACREHQLSTTRHNRIWHRGMKYRCVKCGEVLREASGH